MKIKNTLSYSIFILVLVCLLSCKKEKLSPLQSDSAEIPPKELKASACDLMPIAPGNWWIYINPDKTLTRLEISDSTDEFNGTLWLKAKTQQAQNFYSCNRSFVYHWREDGNNGAAQPNTADAITLIKENPKVGDQWHSGVENQFMVDMVIYTVKDILEEVKMRGFTFKNVVVVEEKRYFDTIHTQPVISSSQSWYAPGIGLIRYNIKEDGSASELLQYKIQ
ncbi:MAG: hypothetical protein ACPF8V_08790 [Luteibaculum sp.]